MPFQKVRFVKGRGADATFELHLKDASNTRYHIQKLVPAGHSATADDPPVPGVVKEITIQSMIESPFRGIADLVSVDDLKRADVSTNMPTSGRVEAETMGGSTYVRDYTETDRPPTEPSTEVRIPNWVVMPLPPPGDELPGPQPQK
jgi:hypothetical protein